MITATRRLDRLKKVERAYGQDVYQVTRYDYAAAVQSVSATKDLLTGNGVARVTRNRGQ
jgi:hypothetical protein